MLKHNLSLLVWIAAGGALGAMARYLFALGIKAVNPYHFPFSTLCINVLGGFLVGIVFVYLAKHNYEEQLRAFLVIGVLGGFTTFATFSLETFSLIESDRYLAACIYILASVCLSVLGTWLGVKLLRAL